jgi:U3 small nucleolar RNA-associated protein 10
MSSSLATQLAKNASLNASLLSATRRKPTESYLFPASQASTHDLESIHFLASNAFLQLKSVQPSCRKYEAALFSDAVKDVDRTLLSKEKNEELDVNLKGFIRLLGPWLMEGMVGKILEWLVRRFRCDIRLYLTPKQLTTCHRINEFNVEDVLVLFLPYHESPHFAKMLSILHIKYVSQYRFNFKTLPANIPHNILADPNPASLSSSPLNQLRSIFPAQP